MGAVGSPRKTGGFYVEQKENSGAAPGAGAVPFHGGLRRRKRGHNRAGRVPGKHRHPQRGGENSTPSMTKEEMLEQATECSAATINNDTLDNAARAKQTYCGKTLQIKGSVTDISVDHITMGLPNLNIEVYLSNEDILEVENGLLITIVGYMGEEIVEGTVAPGIPQKIYTYEVKSAYLVTDRYEYTGTPKSENDSFPGAWNVEFPNDAYLKLVYFDDSIDVSQYVRKEITFSAKNIDGKYYDAVIVE